MADGVGDAPAEVPFVGRGRATEVPFVGRGRTTVAVEFTGTITLAVAVAVPFEGGAVPGGGKEDSVPLLVGNGGTSVGDGEPVSVGMTGTIVSAAVPFTVVVEIVSEVALSDSVVYNGRGRHYLWGQHRRESWYSREQ